MFLPLITLKRCHKFITQRCDKFTPGIRTHMPSKILIKLACKLSNCHYAYLTRSVSKRDRGMSTDEIELFWRWLLIFHLFREKTLLGTAVVHSLHTRTRAKFTFKPPDMRNLITHFLLSCRAPDNNRIIFAHSIHTGHTKSNFYASPY
jgi:hypothetical protein